MQFEDHEKKSEQGFWDIASLVPPRKSSYQAPPRRDTEAVEINLPPVNSHSHAASPAKEKEKDCGEAPVLPGAPSPCDGQARVTRMSETRGVMVGDVPLPKQYVHAAYLKEQEDRPVPESVYCPKGTLLREVRVYPHKSEYNYYNEFCRYAKRLLPLGGRECQRVSYFSYMPQYSQLNRSQLNWYLWWRTSLRRGVALDTDYSYLLLYLYEIINLGDAIDPKTGQESMLFLWLSYRERYQRLDGIMREWLCDYSLLHRLPPPRLPLDLRGALLAGCRLKEFYVSAAEDDVMCDAVLYFGSNYDYRKSKFYRGDAKEHFDRVMRGAVKEALHFLEETRESEKAPFGGFCTVTRDAFSGALCAYAQKKHIEVDFFSFSHTYELRYIITDVLKYAENALRGVLGIKSRLTAYRMETPLCERIDRYLADALPKKAESKKAAPPPLYEQRYDLPVRALSLERAASIEAASWQTTKRLVEAFEEQPTPEKEESLPQTPPTQGAALPPPKATTVEVPSLTPEQGEEGTTLASLLGALAPFVILAARRDRAAQRAFALEMGSMPDAIADKINTVAGDMIGDIILEDLGGTYAVVEDYRELLQEEGILP